MNIFFRKTDKIDKIAKSGEILFHTQDLANLWRIKDSNTLYIQIKRYVDRGILFRIYKGFYSLKPLNEIEPILLGARALHEFCYVSAETVLFQAGIIQQYSNKITFVSSKSRKFKIGKNNYYSRKLSDKYLFNLTGIKNKGGINFADVSRAVADMLYFNPNAHFDAERLINWKNVRTIQKEIGYPIIK